MLLLEKFMHRPWSKGLWLTCIRWIIKYEARQAQFDTEIPAHLMIFTKKRHVQVHVNTGTCKFPYFLAIIVAIAVTILSDTHAQVIQAIIGRIKTFPLYFQLPYAKAIEALLIGWKKLYVCLYVTDSTLNRTIPQK